MKTSNSSRHLNGESMASHRDMMKQTVVNERSPPERALVFLVVCDRLLWQSIRTSGYIIIRNEFQNRQ